MYAIRRVVFYKNHVKSCFKTWYPLRVFTYRKIYRDIITQIYLFYSNKPIVLHYGVKNILFLRYYGITE
jgi:hypothetical protein